MDADFLLIQKMRRGDEEAFDLFVRKYYGEILNYCHYHCCDSSYAADLTQETFLRFFEKLSAYWRGRTKNYLYTIAGNLCRDYYKKRKPCFLGDEEAKGQTGAGQSETEAILGRITVEAAVKSLPEELREVVVLYYFQELKITEIADVLQIGVSLVKYRMRQARKKLEYLLREE